MDRLAALLREPGMFPRANKLQRYVDELEKWQEIQVDAVAR